MDETAHGRNSINHSQAPGVQREVCFRIKNAPCQNSFRQLVAVASGDNEAPKPIELRRFRDQPLTVAGGEHQPKAAKK